MARACSICGELGHRADNLRHRAAATEPAPDVASTPPEVAANATQEFPESFQAEVDAVPPAPRPRRPMSRGFPVGPQPTRKKRLPPQCGRCGSFTHLVDTPGAHPDVSGDDAGHGGAAAEQSAPGPVRLRWTPEPSSEDGDTDVVPVIALARKVLAKRRESGTAYTTEVFTAAANRRYPGESQTRLHAVADDEGLPARPITRGDCANVPRPCPFVSCQNHLYLDVNEESGSLRFNHPDKEPWELAETCALDVADAGGATLEAVGDISGLTRERIRQIEVSAIEKLRRGVPEAREADSPGPALRHPHGEVAA